MFIREVRRRYDLQKYWKGTAAASDDTEHSAAEASQEVWSEPRKLVIVVGQRDTTVVCGVLAY